LRDCETEGVQYVWIALRLQQTAAYAECPNRIIKNGRPDDESIWYIAAETEQAGQSDAFSARFMEIAGVPAF
jgi:hypothetical protein